MAQVTIADLMSDLLRSDPQSYLELVQEFVRQNPNDWRGYGFRHEAWSELGRHDLALADIDNAIALREPHPLLHLLRGMVLRRLNRHQAAVEEFGRSREMDPESWVHMFGPLYRG